MNRDGKTVVGHARFLQPGKTIDIAEFLMAMNDVGFAPQSMRILTPEKMVVGPGMQNDHDQHPELATTQAN